MADLCCDAEPLLICKVVKQELVDTHPFFFVVFSLQREEILRPVAEQEILQGPSHIMRIHAETVRLSISKEYWNVTFKTHKPVRIPNAPTNYMPKSSQQCHREGRTLLI